MQPLISIIVPVYKAEQYIARCIESIQYQTYENLEIILVDDGSPDNSGKICDDYAKDDERIIVIHQQNGGISAARNAGLDIAKGEYIGLIDSDDFVHPDMYAKLLKNLVKSDAQIAMCRYQVTYESEMDEHIAEGASNVISRDEAFDELFRYHAMTLILVWNKLYKRELFDNIRYPQGRIYEDERTTYQLIYKTERIVCLNSPYYYYFQSDDSFIRSGFHRERIQFAEAMEDRLNFLKEKNLTCIYPIALKSYVLWLYSFYYMNRKNLKPFPDIKKKLFKKQHLFTDEMLKQISLPPYARQIYFLAKGMPYWAGFLIYMKFYRKNFITKIVDYIFDDQSILESDSQIFK